MQCFCVIKNHCWQAILVMGFTGATGSSNLSTVWCALRPSQQPTVSLNYSQSIKKNIRRWDDHTIVQSFHLITYIEDCRIFTYISDVTRYDVSLTHFSVCWIQKRYLQLHCIYTVLSILTIISQKLEPVFCKKQQKKVPDQLLVCEIGDLWRFWMV